MYPTSYYIKLYFTYCTLLMNCKHLLIGISGSSYYYTISTALRLYIQHIMEKLNYNYSSKNIPTPTKTTYQLASIEKNRKLN